MDFFKFIGCYELKFRYMCLSVAEHVNQSQVSNLFQCEVTILPGNN